MDVRPIHTEADLDWALGEISRLWGAQAGTPEADRLDVLATLVEAYESALCPVPETDPVGMLEFAIEDMGRSQAELADLLGSRSRASEILNRRRRLTLEQVRLICEAWHLPAQVMIRAYDLADDAA